MIEVTKQIKVDLVRRSQSRLVFATQNDVGSRRIVVTVTDDGRPVEFDSGMTACAIFLRPDGASAATLCELGEGGTVAFTIPLWALCVVGEVKCSISLFGDGESKLTSSQFSLDVERELYNGNDIIEDEDYPLMTSLMSDIAGLVAEEEERQKAENERKLAEQAREDKMKLICDHGVVIVSEDEPEADMANIWINPSATAEVLILEDGDLAAIEDALDGIIAVQDELMGGGSV